MPVVAWFTVIVAGLIIVAAAIGLLRVVLHLKVVDSTLEQAVVNTDSLKELHTTIEAAGAITAGLARGRARLGG